MIQLNNASRWPSRIFGNTTVYSADPAFFSTSLDDSKLYTPNFWANIYTAFACVIISDLDDNIVVVRDHFGLEPLYYSLSNNQLIFGSNLPDIIAQHPQIITNSKQILNTLIGLTLEVEKYSDETYYKNIYRVEPGHLLKINNKNINNRSEKICFWKLDKFADSIEYKNDDDYVDHFSSLLTEAVTIQTNNKKSIAAEYSGGLDSTSVLLALSKNNINPELFIHTPPPTENQDTREIICAKKVVQQLRIKNVNYVDASEFDLIETVHNCAKYFAGAPPYLFSIFAGNIHQSVTKKGYNILLSGFGGDQCISGHAPLHACISQLHSQQQYKLAWHELRCYYQMQGTVSSNMLRRFLHLLKLSHPLLFNTLSKTGNIGNIILSYIKDNPLELKIKLIKLSGKKYGYNSLRNFEYDLLQGKRSHEIRMNIEYSAVFGKANGFKYQYPLLYPKLVDFCFRLPLEQKRRNGVNRYLIRKYLSRALPSDLFDNHVKNGAGFIMPATMAKAADLFQTSTFNEIFQQLPFQNEIEHIAKMSNSAFPSNLHLMKLYAYMFKYYSEQML
jgi:asparagine synthase (glutamine-hydrolysing)